MPDPHDFQPRLADAFRRYANQAPTDVDATALAREIATASAEERHRHPRWWPFGQRQDNQGRSKTMFMAIGTTAVVAALALGASFAYVDQGDRDTEQGPAAAESGAVGDDWAFFSGTLTFDGSGIAGDALIESVNGLVVRSEVGYAGQTLATTDPRMNGIRTELNNSHENLLGGQASSFGSIWSNTATITSDGGTWTCLLEGVAVDNDLAAEGGWCEGAGGFDGLSAFIMFDIHDGSAYDEVATFGYITNGDGPPAPEPYTE